MFHKHYIINGKVANDNEGKESRIVYLFFNQRQEQKIRNLKLALPNINP